MIDYITIGDILIQIYRYYGGLTKRCGLKSNDIHMTWVADEIDNWTSIFNDAKPIHCYGMLDYEDCDDCPYYEPCYDFAGRFDAVTKVMLTEDT